MVCCIPSASYLAFVPRWSIVRLPCLRSIDD
jgi:hypothetical protein